MRCVKDTLIKFACGTEGCTASGCMGINYCTLPVKKNTIIFHPGCFEELVPEEFKIIGEAKLKDGREIKCCSGNRKEDYNYDDQFSNAISFIDLYSMASDRGLIKFGKHVYHEEKVTGRLGHYYNLTIEEHIQLAKDLGFAFCPR